MSVESSVPQGGISHPGAAGRAVFLSYASQDADAARRIAEALRAAGVEVWFDVEGGLEHGDEWDAKIRRQIKECVLFIPLVSANTQSRLEGYFRLEWELAAQRAMSIASGVAFILPVVIDDTREPDALVPDRFRMVQWTRLPGGVVPPDVQARFLKLWSHRTGALTHEQTVGGALRPDSSEPSRRKAAPTMKSKRWLVPAIIGVLAIAALALWQPWRTGAPVTANPTEAAQLAERARWLCTGIFSRDELDLAENLARRATELEPALARAWAVRAETQATYLLRGFATGDTAARRARDAQAFASQALALDPSDTEALIALGLVADHQQLHLQAQQFYRRALEADPEHPLVRRFLSLSCRYNGQLAEAVTWGQEAVKHRPQDPLAHFELGLAYLSAWDFPRAWSAAESSLAASPFIGATILKAKLALDWKGDAALMRQQLDQLSSASRAEDESVYFDLLCGLAERRLDRVLEAAARTPRDYLEEFNYTGPKALFTGLAYHLAGKEQLARLEWEAAERLLRERRQADPQNLQHQLQLAMTLAWLGRGTEAAREFEPVELAWREQMTPGRASDLARYYAIVGDAAHAVPLLGQALYVGDGRTGLTIPRLRLDPHWDNVRDAPEFQAVLASREPKS